MTVPERLIEVKMRQVGRLVQVGNEMTQACDHTINSTEWLVKMRAARDALNDVLTLSDRIRRAEQN